MNWSETLHERWRAAGHRSELVRFPDGGHGFGMKKQGKSSDHWIADFHAWLVAVTEAPAGTTGG